MENYYSRYMNKFIAMAPCIYFAPTQHYEYVEGYGKMRELGINVLYGPNWDSHAEVICDNMSQSWCKLANKRKSKFYPPTPLKSFEWSYQISVSDRY